MSHTSKIGPSTQTLKVVATWLMVLVVVLAMGFLWSVRETPLVETTPVVLPGAA